MQADHGAEESPKKESELGETGGEFSDAGSDAISEGCWEEFHAHGLEMEAARVGGPSGPASSSAGAMGAAEDAAAAPPPLKAATKRAKAKQQPASKNERKVDRPELPFDLFELCPGGGPVRGLSCKCRRHVDERNAART